MTLDGDRRKGDGTEAQGIKFLQGSAGKKRGNKRCDQLCFGGKAKKRRSFPRLCRQGLADPWRLLRTRQFESLPFQVSGCEDSGDYGQPDAEASRMSFFLLLKRKDFLDAELPGKRPIFYSLL